MERTSKGFIMHIASSSSVVGEGRKERWMERTLVTDYLIGADQKISNYF